MNIAIVSIAALRTKKESTFITAFSLAKEMKGKGHNVVIIAEKLNPRLKKTVEETTIEETCFNDEEIVEGIKIYRPYRLPFLSKLFFPSLALRWVQNKEGCKFDIIHGISSTPFFVISLLLSKINCPKAKLIHTLRSYSRRKADFAYFLLNMADAVTVPTKEFSDKLRKVSKKKIIKSPLRLNQFFPQENEFLKEKYKNRKIILHYGSMAKNKGVDGLIRTIPHLVKSNEELLFLFIPRYAQISPEKELVKKLGVETNVEFITDDVKIEDYVNLADVIVLPYLTLKGTEGNPSCLLEAMACKTPVVTTDLPELIEIFDDCLLFAKADDVNSLTETIKFAFANPSPEKIEKAYQISKEFDVKKIAEEFLNLYDEV